MIKSYSYLSRSGGYLMIPKHTQYIPRFESAINVTLSFPDEYIADCVERLVRGTAYYNTRWDWYYTNHYSLYLQRGPQDTFKTIQPIVFIPVNQLWLDGKTHASGIFVLGSGVEEVYFHV